MVSEKSDGDKNPDMDRDKDRDSIENTDIGQEAAAQEAKEAAEAEPAQEPEEAAEVKPEAGAAPETAPEAEAAPEAEDTTKDAAEESEELPPEDNTKEETEETQDQGPAQESEETAAEDSGEATEAAAEDLEEAAAEEPAAKSRKKAAIIAVSAAAAVVILLFAAYCVLCAVVKNSDTILNNVTANGVDVGGLTTEEAALLLEDELSGEMSASVIHVQALGVTYEIPVGGVLETDWEGLAQECYSYGRDTFFACGWIRLTSGSNTVEFESAAYAAYTDELTAVLEASDLAQINTLTETTWEIGEDSIVITMGTTGYTADLDALAQLILEAIGNEDYETVIECPLNEQLPGDIDLEAIYDEIYVEAEDATLDTSDYSIIASVTGVSFDLDEAQSLLTDASDGEVITIEYIYTEPDITTEDLNSKLFSDVLGSYTTTVSGTSARKTNVKLASAACEVVLLPGETFSFNDTVGERTTAKGYQAASAYVSGATVDTIGGGICQVSSTLYVACLYANLEITERHNHSYTVSYMPLGWDATVSWGGPDFQFTNNTNYPIKIEATYSSDNKLTMKIIGTDETGYTVKIVSETYSTTAYETETVEDDSLEEGETVVYQTGYTGYTVQTWRYVYDSDGNLISDDEEAYSKYSKRNKIVHVGVADDEDDDSGGDDEEESTEEPSDDEEESTEEESSE